MQAQRFKTRVVAVRSMTKEDLAFLRTAKALPRIKKLRESHHAVARLLASGKRVGEVAFLTGYTTVRINMLSQDPAFAELVARYRDQATESWRESMDEFSQLAIGNMVRAERQLADKLEEADETNEALPTRELIAITADRADRFGYGKRTTALNINVDFAARLERAISRGKTIEGKALDE